MVYVALEVALWRSLQGWGYPDAYLRFFFLLLFFVHGKQWRPISLPGFSGPRQISTWGTGIRERSLN